ncbi:MAG: ferredoxin family protein [Candidatus Lokiarchaeota archaeon]|nr:ferredoxin family protein [Candidatus Lokiarchaeota archaeon]
MVKITVDLNKCNGDGICVDVCPSGVYELGEDGKSKVINPDECIECLACQDQCPENAITVETD